MPISYKRYNKDFRKLSKHIRFERAKNACEFCGAKNYELHPVFGKKVILTTAHLNHIETDDREENLKALCQACHFAHDLLDNINRKKYGKNYKQNQLSIF